MTAGTLRQHAVAAEAIARGDLLFALYSGDPPPAETTSCGSSPTANESDEVAPRWQREAAAIAPHATGVRCRCSVARVYPLDEAALARIAGMHVWSDRQLSGGSPRASSSTPSSCAPGRRRRAAAGPARDPAARPTTTPAALTDSAFELLVARLEEALSGTARRAGPSRVLRRRLSLERHANG